jgi:asparagine synthase (glutamine-hydrolysing)
MLTGVGGDEWLSGGLFHHAENLRTRRWFAVTREFRAESRTAGCGAALVSLIRGGAWPLLPPFVRRAVAPVRRRPLLPPGIVPEFARRTQILVRIWESRRWLERPSLVKQGLLRDGTGALKALSLELADRSVAAERIEERHPLDDPRIAEFAMAVPDEQVFRRGTTKVVLRGAMKGFVPAAILDRRDKSDFSHVVADALERQEAGMHFANARMTDAGWVNGRILSERFERMLRLRAAGGDDYIREMWPFWMALTVECWYRAEIDRTLGAASMKAGTVSALAA